MVLSIVTSSFSYHGTLICMYLKSTFFITDSAYTSCIIVLNMSLVLNSKMSRGLGLPLYYSLCHLMKNTSRNLHEIAWSNIN